VAKSKNKKRLEKYTWGDDDLIIVVRSGQLSEFKLPVDFDPEEVPDDDIIVIRRRGIKSSDITGKKPKKAE
jgi:hypothetical protein